jgi:hypothetical protein
MNSMSDRDSSSNFTPLGAFFARIYWMAIGLLVLLSLGMAIAVGGFKSISLLHILYWCTAASLIIVRYIDIRKFAGETVDGQPATMQHWKRYSLTVVAGCAVLWALALLARRYLA